MTEKCDYGELLWRLYVNRSDRYLMQLAGGWSWSTDKLTKDIIKQHLAGTIRIGTAELDRESLTKFLLLDIDRHAEKNPAAVERFDDVVKRLHSEVSSASQSLRQAVRFIHTGSGVHMCIFFERKAPARLLKDSFMLPLLERADFRVEGSNWFDGDIQMGEVFPRQDKISKDGYACRLPLGLHKNGNWSEVMFDEDLQSIVPIRLSNELLQSFKSEEKLRKKYPACPEWKTPENKLALPGCIVQLMSRESVHDGLHINNLDLVQALLVSGYSEAEIHGIYSEFKGYSYSTTQYQMSRCTKAIREGRLPARTYKCETYKNSTHGLSCDIATCPRELPSQDTSDIEDDTMNSIPKEMLKFIDFEELQRQQEAAKAAPIPDEDIREMSLDELADILGCTIIEDRTNKLVSFQSGILNYTSEDQQNINYQSGSATGKSYIALEVSEYFPASDLMKRDYASPKSFYHQEGVLMLNIDEDTFLPLISLHKFVSPRMERWEDENPRPERGLVSEWNREKQKREQGLKAEWSVLKKTHVIDLRQKILIFKDMPHDELLKALRTMLSHDEKIIRVQVVDKSSSGQHATKNIVILGYPTVFFLSANFSLDEQERTRVFLLSADITQTKLYDSVGMIFEKHSNRAQFKENLALNKRRAKLRNRVELIKQAAIREILIPPRLRDNLKERFYTRHTNSGNDVSLAPRHQRDVVRLISMVKGSALLNLFFRERENDHTVICNETDIEAGFTLYEGIADANELGITPQVYEFYQEELKELKGGITRNEFKSLWFERYQERMSYARTKNLVHLMSNVGLIVEEPDPDDKRRYLIHLPDGERPKGTEQERLDVEGLKLTKKEKKFLEEHQAGSGFTPKAADMKTVLKLLEKGLVEEAEPGKGIWRLTSKQPTSRQPEPEKGLHMLVARLRELWKMCGLELDGILLMKDLDDIPDLRNTGEFLAECVEVKLLEVVKLNKQWRLSAQGVRLVRDAVYPKKKTGERVKGGSSDD